MLGSCNQLAITLGILLVYVLGLSALRLGWRNLAFVGLVPSAALLLLALTVLPETPRWLCATHQPDAARRSLTKLRGTAHVHAELSSIEVRRSPLSPPPHPTPP